MAIDRILKVKKKKWVEILAPDLFKNEVIGETYLADPKNVIGKKVSVSLMQLIKDPKKQSIHVKFLIKDLQNGKAITEIQGYRMIPAAVRRLVRRRRDKIEDSFLCLTKDNKTIRIKPLIITFSNTSNLVLSKMRAKAKAFIIRKAKSTGFDDLITSLLTNSFQKELRDHVKKLYPVRLVEVRYVGIETLRKKKKVEETEVEQDGVEGELEETSEEGAPESKKKK